MSSLADGVSADASAGFGAAVCGGCARHLSGSAQVMGRWGDEEKKKSGHDIYPMTDPYVCMVYIYMLTKNWGFCSW